MSDQEVWCPDAEPWEALYEADVRTGTAPGGGGDLIGIWKDQAEALSEMGWTLAPGGSDGWRDGYNKGYEHGWEQCAAAVHEYRGQVRDLEAENKRLKDGLETVCEVGDRAAVVAAREALAGSPGGDEQPSQREYVEAFDRARRRVEGGAFDEPASGPVPESDGPVDPEGDAAYWRGEYENVCRSLKTVHGQIEQFEAGVESLGDGQFRFWADDLLALGWAKLFAEKPDNIFAEAPVPPPSPVPEELEGERALRFLRELRQYLDRRLRKYGDGEGLSDYEVGCKQELEGVSTWLAEFEAQPAPVPVEEPETGLISEAELRERNEMPSPAPEIKEPEPGQPVECDKCGSVTFATAEEVVEWLREPSLDLEGLAKLDAEIERLAGSHRGRALLDEEKLMAYRQARELLVSGEAENGE